MSLAAAARCCFSAGAGADTSDVDRRISEAAKEDFKRRQKIIQLLLLGTGESGKSTICKQMQIIHINGFSFQERMQRAAHMRRNIRDSLACILAAMEKFGIPCAQPQAAERSAWLLQQMSADRLHNCGCVEQDPFPYDDQFYDAVQLLWHDAGVQRGFSVSERYQLIDCAKYFLDRCDLFRDPHYTPTDQDILRCRVMTNSITDIQFDIMDGRNSVRFRVYDVGGQKGERKKWIQCFNNVTAILYLCDVSSFDLTLKEDVGAPRPKNRLLESLDTFQEVWLNRYLQDVSLLLFINKIDQLDDKVRAGKSARCLLRFCREEQQLRRRRASAAAETAAAAAAAAAGDGTETDDTEEWRRRCGGGDGASGDKAKKKKNVGPLDLCRFISELDFDRFVPSEEDRKEFLVSFPRPEESATANGATSASTGKARPQRAAEQPSVHPDTVKTACFVKNVFMEIAKRKRQFRHKYEYHHHTCCYYYTCAVNTDNVKKVLEGCRAFIIDKHLERFGIL